MSEALSPYNHQKNEHCLVRIKGEVKCICELCSCGQHKCPTKRVLGDFQTSYNNHYQSFAVTPLPYHPKYTYNERHYNPQSLRTNYQQTYIPLEQTQPTVASSRLQSIGRVILKSQPFVAATSYKEEYKPFKIQNELNQRVSTPKQESLKDSKERPMIKFQGESAYKSAHQPLPIPKIERYKQPDYKPTKAFHGSSSYKDNFIGYRIEALRDLPKMQTNDKQVKFEGSSTYNNHYGTFKVAAEQNQAASCRIDQLNIRPNSYLRNEGSGSRQMAKSSLK